MVQVGPRLVQGADREPFGRRAVAQAGRLREDEPHPMAGFAASAKLTADLIDHRVLSIDEPLQIEGVFHPGARKLSRAAETNAKTSNLTVRS